MGVSVKSNQKGMTLIEVITALMVLGLVFSAILPGLYLVNRLEDADSSERQDSYIERMMSVYFKKQVYQSEVIYDKGGILYLQDLETPDYYNRYSLSGSTIMRYKYRKTTDNNLVSIGLGGTSQFERGFQSFSIKFSPENEEFIEITYRLTDKMETEEILIEHGKKIESIS
ncbi:prepilin-type N-terminal cleavage/methylation domain-containing protein [Eubacteriaceae bacterium ES3]|nr:prepilin-type N-terminal cleavage/methylation domain-containing protein [Eubacteriaceae bacterium ES3]